MENPKIGRASLGTSCQRPPWHRIRKYCCAVFLLLMAVIPISRAVGIKEVHDGIWLVSFMDCDLGYFDLDTRVLEPLENPFGPKVLPM